MGVRHFFLNRPEAESKTANKDGRHGGRNCCSKAVKTRGQSQGNMATLTKGKVRTSLK